MVEGDLVKHRTGALKNAQSALFGFCVVDKNVHPFPRGEQAHDLGIDPGDGLKFSGPVFGVVGPGEPGGLVPIPFGGHAVTELVGCLRHFWNS